MTNPIEIAVAPLKEVAIEGAIEYAKKYLASLKSELEAANWDLRAVAPEPSARMSRSEYKIAERKRKLFLGLVNLRKDNDTSIRRNNMPPQYCDWSVTGAVAFVEEAKLETAMQFDGYVEKLTSKIGQVQDAQITVNRGVWGESVLTVTKHDGSVERWKTQQIYNISSLGKVFPQWPTRKIR